MGMGWKVLSHPEIEVLHSRPCKCSKGVVREIKMITEESEMFPFERCRIYTETSCPDKCESNY